MSTSFPLYIYPKRLPAEGVSLSGRLKLQDMGRIAELLVKPFTSDVQVTLEFGRLGKFRTISGAIRCELALQCQRCLQAKPLLVDHTFALALLTHEKNIEQLPDEYDPLLITDDPISVNQIVEDELLLVLPLVPMHTEAECQAKLASYAEPQGNNSQSASETTKKPANPFDVLKNLKINQ